MKMPNSIREKHFEMGREINPALGTLFQNQMEILPEHADIELAEIQKMEFALQAYKSHVLMIKRQSHG